MSSSGTSPDFGSLAPTYDRLRPPDERWREVTDALVRLGDLRGRRVLDVGCGTGTLAAELAERHAAKVWGVDRSPEMLEVARSRVPAGVGLKRGTAEELPFREGWFERAVVRLALHLVDRPRALAEIRRVLGPDGRFAAATFDPAHFHEYWLNAFFPSLEAIDRARFPTRDELEGELAAAGFGPPEVVRLDQQASIERADALERIRGRYISTLRLLDEDELAAGVERAEAELPERVEYELRWLLVAAPAAI
jgi:ubiquinone/menaquinone biosynthesis C-methylase UbiE